jgi:hypothetical protein
MIFRAKLFIAGLVVVGLASASGHAATGIVHFRSPSGNINCFLAPSFADCLVRHNTWTHKPTKPASCDLDFDPTELELGPRSVSVGGCRGDVGPLCGLSDTPCTVLRYGQSVTRGRLRCTSAVTGVICRRLDGRRIGFRIAREGYQLYR